MSKMERKKKLIEKLKNKEYRDAFVSEHVDTGIPFQIKALRNQRHWTQQDLAKRTGMKQARISKLEDPDYSRFTLATLKKLASAFDVGLVVRYVPVSELVEWELNLSSEALKAVSFDQDAYFNNTQESSAGYFNLISAASVFAANAEIVVNADTVVKDVESPLTYEDAECSFYYLNKKDEFRSTKND